MLLVETDSPYLTPVLRGKRNYPGYVRLVEKIAEIKEIPFEEVARQTSLNGKRLSE